MTQPLPIIACSRPHGRVAGRLRELGAEVQTLPLEVTWRPLPDRYRLGEARVVERFTTAQFARAIAKKTLFFTALDLRASERQAVFVIEGESYPERSALHPNAIRGALSALIAEYGGSVLRTEDEEDSAGLLLMLARHAQFGVPEISLAAKRKAGSPSDEQRRVVEMLPGVGFTLARRLLQTFGSIRAIMEATPQELARVRGLTEASAKRLLEVFGREYCAVDFEADLEWALAERPDLLFRQPVTLLARQHVFRDAAGNRLVADLVFADHGGEYVYVVEVKRGAIQEADMRQLSGYLDAADRSPLLSDHLRRGYGLRGILAASEARVRRTADRRIEVRVVSADKAAQELVRRRGQAAR
jgi:ERCC4-type nuclease